jgi:hypothetical protein
LLTYLAIKQRVNDKLGKTPTESYEMLQTVYGDEVISCSSVFEWFKRFKYGSEGLQDDPRSGCPSTSQNADTITNICKMMAQDRRLTLIMMLDELNINKDTIHQVLHEDLWKRKICGKFVPPGLMDEQNQRRLTSSRLGKTIPFFLIAFFSFLR